MECLEYSGRILEFRGRRIGIGGSEPELKEGEIFKRKTQSLCPECYRLLPAIVFERDGSIWIRRICSEHGEIEELYWGDSSLYERVMMFEAPSSNIKITYKSLENPCPFSCGLCPIHVTQTCLANVVVTNRCDLSCWYCFFYSEKAGYVYEPSIEKYKEMMEALARQHPIGARAIQLTGGEPLLRDDLVDLVKVTREAGIDHIQLNTNGLRFLYDMDGVNLSRRLREAGVNTIYLSFDGVSPDVNFKNHWEIPYIFENFRKSGMTSVVLVPTVIKGWNTHELGSIVKFAALNMDIVRGVNFQPVSLVGMMPKSEREKYRVTIPEVIRLIEEQTNGEIDRNSWYPVPTAYIISRFIEAFSRREQWHMKIHPACGMATYVYVDRKGGEVRFIPITEMIDVNGFLKYLKESTGRLEKGGNKYINGLKLLLKLRKHIRKDKLPEGFDPIKIIFNAFVRHNYEALAEFHYRFLYLGMMHFMDLYNYDVDRVRRCGVHYVTPELEVIPFCTFNVLSDLYRDFSQKNNSISLEDYVRRFGENKIGEYIKYKRDKKKLEAGEVYRKTYTPFLKSKL
ncbi:MAG: radical SAM protein [Candidatus Methanomethylicia archaeon]